MLLIDITQAVHEENTISAVESPVLKGFKRTKIAFASLGDEIIGTIIHDL